MGRDNLLATIRHGFDWPQMWLDASEILSSCPRCQQFGPRLRNFLLQPIVRLHPFQLFATGYLRFFYSLIL